LLFVILCLAGIATSLLAVVMCLALLSCLLSCLHLASLAIGLLQHMSVVRSFYFARLRGDLPPYQPQGARRLLVAYQRLC